MLLLCSYLPLFCRFLAKQYGLTKDTIANGLPLIDTTATLIAKYCPSFLMTPRCEIQRWTNGTKPNPGIIDIADLRYRTTEGTCNNLENPNWGMAKNGHHR